MAQTNSSFLEYLQMPNPLHVGQAKLFRGREFQYDRDVYNMDHRFAFYCRGAQRAWVIRVSWQSIERASSEEVANAIIFRALEQLFDAHDRNCPICRPVEVEFSPEGPVALYWTKEEKEETPPKPTRIIRFRRKV